MRPSWDEYFMEIAQIVKKRSTCLRRSIGAVIVKDKQILSTGYNGAPKNLKHCEQLGCERERLNIPSGQRHELCRALHAEQNAIIQAAYNGVSVKGATLYTTTRPCSLCAKMCINAGIERIVFKGDYPDDMSINLLKEANVELCCIDTE
ncbi:dCMP deaminase [Alkalithermobacter thermoalcaliphilus JW-YL-7 = DSM 7308]|uniref:dCMP deaminase n=1 Tax=Alkalithermobacter thermoalcaliphilus JW-YL-7 = DSM 7308 TaxID=1121328 RepID=A0A150FSE0_CLOPD|nr:CMP/dCMP deaminase zinc-binding protein [[Clostridium] paradoxum JW-YL-7 = DSM 7308]SHK71615.1 dCMP deaminase [[Clostridium] paradoxum JW-YL-7 = DSM 7308]